MFLKYSLKFLLLKNLSKHFFLTFISIKGKTWFLIFSIQVCINCLYSSLMEGIKIDIKVVIKAKATLKIKSILKAGFKAKT